MVKNEKAKKQLLLASISLTILISCSSYRVTSSDLRKSGERYSNLFYNSEYHVKFHSYGGRHLAKRLFFHSYGKLIFTYDNKLRESNKKKGNNVYYSLFIVEKIPENILQKNDTVMVKLYNKELTSFRENYRKGNRKIYKRYFISGSKNYLFIGEYKRFYKDEPKIYQYHMSQEMEGLEL
ncbi:hypothetical protein [Pedobacter agri]|uniref:hypothetical protein n=1 Tax=Pedobacter agri TaxID=454586 RepID=UPI002930CBA8|nr:hypothetical protein [Pedobacter agri]